MIPIPVFITLGFMSLAGESLWQVQDPPKDSPAWVIEQYFAQKNFPNKTQYIAGEMAEHYSNSPTIGSAVPPGMRVTYRPLVVQESTAIYSVYIRDSTGGTDFYAYLNRIDRDWKLTAVRSLWLPPLFFMIMDSLSRAPTLPDSMRSWLANMRLTVAPDSALRVFFVAHQAALDRVATGFTRESVGSIVAAPEGLTAPNPELRDLATQLALLNLRRAYRAENHQKCLFVEIGGMIDNEAGFLYAAPDCVVPEMSPERFIYVDHLVGRWFLYKTT